MHQCAYCYQNLSRSKNLLLGPCTCKLCMNCIDYLSKHEQLICPLCKSDISDRENYENSKEAINKSLSLQNPQKTGKIVNDFNSIHLSFKNFRKVFKTFLEDIEMYNFTCKILKNNEELLRLYKFLYISDKFKVFKDLRIFKINLLKPKSFLKNFCNGIMNDILTKLSRIALEREKKKIGIDSNYVFLGSSLGCFMIEYGSCGCQFKILSGTPCQLKALGVGICPGLNSSIFFYNVKITENERTIYEEDPNIELVNDGSRLTKELILSYPVTLKPGNDYNIEFLYHGICFYGIKTTHRVIEAEGFKLKISEGNGLNHNLFYLKLV